MNTIKLMKIVSEQCDFCKKILELKGSEYSHDLDRLVMFKTASKLQDITPEQALVAMMAKHTVSLYSMVQSKKIFSQQKWDEKITDHINYLLLLRACVEETGRLDFSLE